MHSTIDNLKNNFAKELIIDTDKMKENFDFKYK
jgi:hypothetical protein